MKILIHKVERLSNMRGIVTPIIILVVLIYFSLLSVCYGIVESQRITDGNDDAEERLSNGRMGRGSSDLELGYDGSRRQAVGMRFTRISIPQGATINSAYVEFEVDEPDSGTTNLLISGESTDDANSFGGSDYNISSRLKTVAQVVWSPGSWSTNENHQTPDISNVIQELINRSGWSADNDLVILIEPGSGCSNSNCQRTAESYNGESNNAPLLVIDYSIPPPAPVVNSISLASFDPTTANTPVSWAVDFSSSVSGVDVTDFVLVESGGATGSSITSISGSGLTWTVTADTGTSATGTLGLNLVDDDSIVNGSGLPLGDVGVGNGNFVGSVYTITPPAPSLSKTSSAATATIGDIVTFTITATNPYNDPFTNIVISDTLPPGMNYAAHVSTHGAVSVVGQVVTWSVPTLAANSDVQLTLAVSLSGQGSLTNTVTSPGSASSSVTVLVLASAITHFRMDEPVDSWTGAAGEVIDSGGTTLHGRRLTSSSPTSTNIVDPVPTIFSQHSSVVGGFCNAASFDGNAIVQVADSPLLDYTTQLSASAWVYPTAYPASGLYSILSNDVNYEFHLDSSGHLYWWWQASNLTSANTIPLNQWSHIAITLDSSSGVHRQRIYINGVLDVNTNNWQGTLSTNNCNFHIGGDVGTSDCSIISSRNFRGMIDEVKLYGFELRQQEVLADMRLGRSCSGTFDHIRIEHDGVASICAPERVTIKACMNSDCTVLYPGNVTVNLSPSGWVDGGTFTISGGIGTRQLSRNTPGDVILGTTSVSPLPTFSSRCFNGATETCTLNFADVSCDFDAVESGANPQTPIYTKLSGVSFAIDVLALLNSTTINPAYIGTVAIDLVDATGSPCPTGIGLNSATNITYGPGDAGRITVLFNYPNAARNVKVRATVASSAPACSNDNFAIRPQIFTLTSTDANNPALTGNPIVVAGAPFNLSANAVAGYDGTPIVDSTQLTGTPIAGTLGGNFPVAAPVSGIATGTNFTYSEVGHFGLNQYAVYDETFTAVDQPSDCNSGYSNTLSAGKYGCSFGSVSVLQVVGSSGFGRFVPARFNISNNAPLFDNACSSIFTYMGQPFGYLIDPELTVTALNVSGTTTLNYGGSYWKLNSNLWGRSYSNNAVTAATILPTVTGGVTWSGTGDNDGVGTVNISGEQLSYSKPPSPESPFTADADLVFTIADMTDSDGVCFDPENDSVCNGYTISSIIGGEQRYGRMQLQNSYGSESLPLTIPILTEYYNGSGFVPNSLDNCTSYSVSNLTLSYLPGNLNPGETTASGSGTLLSGIGNSLSLSAPGVGNDGSVDLTLDLSQASGADMEWLQPGGNNPTSKATFGIYKGNQRLIYMRESIW